jgi:hypothetical protein
LRAELVRLLALVAALAVVTGAWLAGQRYYYCAPMARIALDECCAHEHDEAHATVADTHATIAELPRRCCEERVFDAGDRGASDAPPSVPPAPSLPVVAILDVVAPKSAPVFARAPHESRAGPTRGSPLSWRTTIDVSRT